MDLISVLQSIVKSEEVMHGNDGMHVRGVSLFLSLLLIVINTVPSRLVLPCFHVSLQHLIIITNMSCMLIMFQAYC